MHWSGAAKTFFFLVPRRCWVQVAADNAQYAAVLDEHCKPVTNLLVVLEFSMHKPTPRIVSCTPAMSCRHWKRSLARWILSCWSMVNIGNRVTPFVLVQRPNWLTPIHSYQEHITVAWSMAVTWHQILVYLSDGSKSFNWTRVTRPSPTHWRGECQQSCSHTLIMLCDSHLSSM